MYATRLQQATAHDLGSSEKVKHVGLLQAYYSLYLPLLQLCARVPEIGCFFHSTMILHTFFFFFSRAHLPFLESLTYID